MHSRKVHSPDYPEATLLKICVFRLCNASGIGPMQSNTAQLSTNLKPGFGLAPPVL